MGFFKKLPHKATTTELKEINMKLSGEMQGLTQKWALDSLGVERLFPLINIADNEKLGATKAILYAYRFGYLDGKEKCDDSREMGCRQAILGVINQIDSLEHLRKIYTAAKVYLKILKEDEKEAEKGGNGNE